MGAEQRWDIKIQSPLESGKSLKPFVKAHKDWEEPLKYQGRQQENPLEWLNCCN